MSQADDISHGFDAGNYANAYETTDFETAIGRLSPNRSDDYTAAFTLGFFASCATAEIPASAIDAYREAYYSDAGQACITAGYVDARDDLGAE
jgi:hypothetical protein